MSKVPLGDLASAASRLKPTGGVAHDSSKPRLTGFVSESDVKDYQGRMLDLNIEVGALFA